MSERYKHLFRLPDELYLEGAPVMIAAGALLMDQISGGIVAQLKLRNIGDKHIRTVKAVIEPLDSMDRPLDAVTEFECLDLDAPRDGEFGQKKAIHLPTPTARAFRARIAEVGFTDKTIWTAPDAAWTPLPRREALEIALNDAELLKQYKLEFGSNARFLPVRDRDLFRCFCGAVNRRAEETCHRCGCKPEYDPDAVKAHCAQRVAEERQREEKEAAARAAKAKKTKKTLAITIPAAAVVIAAVLLVTLVVIPNKRYERAIALAEAEEYEQAITAFEALDGYKDSTEWLNYARNGQKNLAAYREAQRLMESGDYSAAMAAFEALGDYRDSIDKRDEAGDKILFADYQEALKLMENGDYSAAIAAFDALGDYRDSVEKRDEAAEKVYLKAKHMMDGEEYDEAVIVFEFLGSYRDSAELLAECRRMDILSSLLKFEGTYKGERTNDAVTFSVREVDGTAYAYIERNASEWSGTVEQEPSGKYEYRAAMRLKGSKTNLWVYIKNNMLVFGDLTYVKN